MRLTTTKRPRRQPRQHQAASGSKPKPLGVPSKGPKTAPVKRRVDKTDVQFVYPCSTDSVLTPSRALQCTKRPKVTIHDEHEKKQERAPADDSVDAQGADTADTRPHHDDTAHADADPEHANDEKYIQVASQAAFASKGKHHSLRVLSTLDQPPATVAAPPRLAQSSFASSQRSSEYDMADPYDVSETQCNVSL